MSEDALYKNYAKVLEGIIECATSEVEATPWQSTPVEANVYQDDNQWTIHLWKDGVSHDIHIPKRAKPC